MMPRHIDREQRRREILHATIQVLAESGMSGLSFRAIGERLGGSTTVVTHYFSSQAQLLNDLANAMIEEWETELAALETSAASDEERLFVLLDWLVPQSEAELVEEQTRIILLSEGLLGAATEVVFSSWDGKMRELLRNHLRNLVPPEQLELRVDMLRSITNGLALSVLEHPNSWSEERIRAVLDGALGDMGITISRSPDQIPDRG
jgi:AcrR family transcriptional regulator